MFKVTTTVYSPDFDDNDLTFFRESSWELINQMYLRGVTNGEKEVDYQPDAVVIIRVFSTSEAANEWKDWLVSNIPDKWKDKIVNVIEETV